MRVIAVEFGELHNLRLVYLPDVVLVAYSAFEDEVEKVGIRLSVLIEASDNDFLDRSLEHFPGKDVYRLMLENRVLEALEPVMAFKLFPLLILQVIKTRLLYLKLLIYDCVLLLAVLLGDDPADPELEDAVLLLLEVFYERFHLAYPLRRGFGHDGRLDSLKEILELVCVVLVDKLV